MTKVDRLFICLIRAGPDFESLEEEGFECGEFVEVDFEECDVFFELVDDTWELGG